MKFNFWLGVCLWALYTAVLIFHAHRLWGSRSQSAATPDFDYAEATRKTIRDATEATEGQFIIHMPEEGCPEGWERQAEIFVKDGQKRDGCRLVKSEKGEGHVDYIAAGESYMIEIPLPPEIQELFRPKANPKL